MQDVRRLFAFEIPETFATLELVVEIAGEQGHDDGHRDDANTRGRGH